MGILLANPITEFLGKIMGVIYDVLSSIGLNSTVYSIILFTIIVYTLMLPFTIKQQKFTRISAIMNPELQAIQKKYKDKKDQASMMKMQDETKFIYQKYGTSPMGGCLGSLIQLPILFALWPVIQNIKDYIEPVGNYNRFLFYKNTAEVTSTAISNYTKPLNVWMIIALVMIPILSGATQWASMKLSQSSTQVKKNNKQDENPMGNSMNAMMKFMPLMSVFLGFSMPIGLNIYWITSAVVRTVQQIVINKQLDKTPIEDLIKKNVEKMAKKNAKRKGAVDSKTVNEMAKKYTKRIEDMKAEIDSDNKKQQQRTVERKEPSNIEYSYKSKPGSLAAKANMVNEYNNRNNK